MNRAELVKTLELIKPALATTNMVPIFQCFCFGGDDAPVSAYNDQIGIIGPTDFDVGGSVGLHGQTLLGLLSSSKAEEISFSQKGQEVTLTMGKSVSKLPFQSSADFIFNVPDNKWDDKIAFTESMANALHVCLETVSTDATQAALLGISLMGNHLYSCNGDSLTRIKIKQGVKGRVLMPTAFCAAVLRLWAALEMTKGVLHFSNDWLHADFGDWHVYGRVLEIADPIDFEELIKRNLKDKHPTQDIPDEFSEALSRARVLADPESQKTVVTVSNGKASLLTETHMGEVRDNFALKGHPDVVASINASHVSRAIKQSAKLLIMENCLLFEAEDTLMLVSNMT